MSTLSLHKLTSASPDVEDTLPRILTLSNEVFGSTPNSSSYATLDVWRKRLGMPGAFIVYLEPRPASPGPVATAAHVATDGPSSGQTTPTTPVAFLFALPRTHEPPLEAGTTRTLHIWLAGVLHAQRRLGCLGRLIRSAECVAGTGAVLTACTVPERFPDMWWWLTRRDWLVERRLDGGKVLLAKTLPDVSGVDTSSASPVV